MNTEENNKMIAEFMGYRIADDQFKDENGFWNDTGVFETSWDWLRPVVDRILDLSFQDEGNEDDFYKVRDCMPSIIQTYNAVVEFINQYNKTK